LAIPVLLILAVLWAAFFVWPLISGRSERRAHDSIHDFTHALGAIGKTGGFRRRKKEPLPSPIPVALPPVRGLANGATQVRVGGMSRAQRRRRDVLLTLGVLVLGSLLLAFLSGSTMLWLVQLLTDGLLVAYVALLVRMKNAALDRRNKVRYLPARRPVPQAPVHTLALRRTASS
jgi:hypothetical protein